MQDRLKFRYFNKHSKKMVYPDNYQNANAIYECLEQQVCFDENLSILPYNHIGNGLVFMQCTGLKDKNGKLIYEGDILFEDWKNEVYPKGRYWIVKWNKNHANFYIEMVNPSKYANFKEWHLARHDLDYEVIGNIYANPELLESEPTNE